MIGTLLALLAAATFALNGATARRGVLAGTVLQGIAITVPLGIPMFFLGALIFGQVGQLFQMSSRGIFFLSLAGIAHFVWGRYFNYRAQYFLGSNLAASVQQMDMLLSLALAVIILGEVLTPIKLFGIALLLIGPAFVVGSRQGAGKKNGAEAKPKSGFEPKYVEGYTCVALCSMGYGMSPILTTLGLREVGADASLAGGVVAYTAATIVATIWVFAAGQTGHVLQTTPTAMRWFTIAGLLVGLSQIFRFAALALAPVTVVQPIQRMSKLFIFYFSWLLNRDKEVFDSSLIVATVVSVIGAIILSIPTETFLSWADWPEWFKSFMRLKIAI